MSQKDYQRIKNYVDICPLEISGFGMLEIKRIASAKHGGSKKIYHIKDLFLPAQEVTGGNTTIKTDKDKDVDSMVNLIKSLPEDQKSKIGFWWHSHVNMGAFWSAEDDETILKWVFSPQIISLVMNKKGDIRLRFTQYVPVFIDIDEDIELEILGSNETYEECKAEIEAKVKEKKYEPPVSVYDNKGTYHTHNNNYHNKHSYSKEYNTYNNNPATIYSNREYWDNYGYDGGYDGYDDDSYPINTYPSAEAQSANKAIVEELKAQSSEVKATETQASTPKGVETQASTPKGVETKASESKTPETFLNHLFKKATEAYNRYCQRENKNVNTSKGDTKQ